MSASRRARAAVEAVAETSIAEAVRSAIPGPEAEEIAKEAVAHARDEFSKMSIEVGRTAFGLGPSRLFADDRTTVSDFLNELYFEIDDFVGPFRYGLEWFSLTPARTSVSPTSAPTGPGQRRENGTTGYFRLLASGPPPACESNE